MALKDGRRWVCRWKRRKLPTRLQVSHDRIPTISAQSVAEGERNGYHGTKPDINTKRAVVPARPQLRRRTTAQKTGRGASTRIGSVIRPNWRARRQSGD